MIEGGTQKELVDYLDYDIMLVFELFAMKKKGTSNDVVVFPFFEVAM